MVHIDEFMHDGKNFMYIDFSRIAASDEYIHALEKVRQAIEKHAENSLYTIINLEYTMFDTTIKELVAQYMEYNKPYVKYGIIIGFDGIKKTIVNSILKKCGRNNIGFAFTKKQAIELLLQQQ